MLQKSKHNNSYIVARDKFHELWKEYFKIKTSTKMDYDEYRTISIKIHIYVLDNPILKNHPKLEIVTNQLIKSLDLEFESDEQYWYEIGLHEEYTETVRLYKQEKKEMMYGVKKIYAIDEHNINYIRLL